MLFVINNLNVDCFYHHFVYYLTLDRIYCKALFSSENTLVGVNGFCNVNNILRRAPERFPVTIPVCPTVCLVNSSLSFACRLTYLSWSMVNFLHSRVSAYK